MKAYCFDYNGVYSGAVDADESPLEPGVFLFPARSTSIAPPQAPAGQVAVWTDNGWVLKQRAPKTENPKGFNEVPKATARQLRLALLDMELLDDVEALMADPSTPRAVKIEWEYANEFDANNQLVVAFAAALQKSSEDVNRLFALAATK